MFARLLFALALVAGALSIGAPAADARLWHGCVRNAERHGFLRTADGVRVAFAEVGRGPRGVVLAHQSERNRCQWLPFARTLAGRGYHALAVDARGNGLSQKVTYPKSIHLSPDLVAAARELRRRGARGVVFVGASMGGAPSIVAAAKLYPALARGAIALGATTNWIADDAETVLRETKLPLLVTVTRDDWTGVTPDSRTLYRAARATDKRLVVVPGRGHGVVTLAIPKIRNAVFAFLARHLPAAR